MPPPADERRFPKLSDTFRRYLTGTARVRVQSPGIERYEPGAGHPRRLAAVLAVVVVVALLLWLALGR